MIAGNLRRLTGARPRVPGLAVVTGASSGLGEALARHLAAQGHPLLVVARRKERLELLAEECGARYGTAVQVRACDLADPGQRALLGDELAALPVEVLCNNAGFPTCGPVATNDATQEADEVSVNVVAVHALTLAVLPGMLARRRGRLLLTGSTAGMQPVPTAATYAATKAFVNSFAQSLHGELRGTGVSCTLLAPGPVRTEFYATGQIEGLQRHSWFAWQDADTVAAAALQGLRQGRRIVVPGPIARAQALAGRHTPHALADPALRLAILPRLRSARSELAGI